VTRPGVDIPVDGLVAFVLRIGLLLAVAEASYRFLEMPIRRGAAGRFWQRVREGDLDRPGPVTMGVATAAALLLAFTGFRVWTAPPPSAGLAGQQLSVLNPARAPLELDFARRLAAEGLDPRTRITAFGDSVLLGSSRGLENVFRVDLHADVAEQAAGLRQRIESQVAAGQVDDLVLVHVGNNGIVTEEHLRGMLGALSGVPRVVLATVRVPRPWMDPNNALIVRVAGDYPNVVVADWAEASEENRDYVVKDGVHLSGLGIEAYTTLIAEAAGVEVES
jgi:hypothetical protein